MVCKFTNKFPTTNRFSSSKLEPFHFWVFKSSPQSQMGRKQPDSEPTRHASLILLLMGIFSCALVYTFLTIITKPSTITTSSSLSESLRLVDNNDGVDAKRDGGCCRGMENVELWGAAVKWGSEFKFNSSEECCNACKGMCSGSDGPCLCDSWVFCGDRQACGSKFGECWLKKQKETLAPEVIEAGPTVMWTSGIIFGKGEGIVGLETEYGTLNIKLFPDCAPHSVAYILEILGLHHCAGCRFHRAEGRGQSWDSKGNHLKDAEFGPPFGLIQGTMEAQGTTFKQIPTEVCPTIRRGSVAWVGSGPEFFISLANHEEWNNAYTVFGSVFPEDLKIAEKLTELPTTQDVWNNINVTVLVNSVPLWFRRIKASRGDL